ncbi:MAG: RsmD family RNA methyltransferase [Ferrimicrobium sp.]
MRILAGDLGGREIAARAPKGVRPTTSKVREAIFSMLSARGVLEDASVLDLFGGTGALGLEALSRGARTVTYVERSSMVAGHAARSALRLGVQGRFLVLVGEVGAVLRRSEFGPVDLVLVDPPYEYADFDQLGQLLPSARLVVVESDREVSLGRRFEVELHRRYGGTVVGVFVPSNRE